jgi:NAD+ diphosphatase
MPEIRTFFSGGPIDRRAELRRDAAALADAWNSAEARFLPVWEARCVVRDGAAARLQREEIGRWLPPPERGIFLGCEGRRPLFAVALDGSEAPAALGHFAGLRELISGLPAAEAALLGYARAMVNWHRHHRRCGACGAPNDLLEGGFVLQCSVPSCAHRSFPRLDPAIIVLAHRGERCLLGRQASWPEQRFSTIAGFVEPGESLEDAVRREVREETNIRIGECQYLASQPWPFPSALMIGFHAQAQSEDILLNDAELAEARWLTREEIARGTVILPPRASVAWKLIEAWFDAEPGRRLAELRQDGAFLRPAGQLPEAS